MTTLDIIIDYISEVLALPASLAASKAGDPVAVHDNSDSPEWRRWHRRAVAKFEDHWRVVRDTEYKYGYLFWRRDR